MRRRRFLAFGALAAAGLPRQGFGTRRARLVVIGAGLAGLAAGDALARAGHDVTILEARSEPGGRVRTLRGFAGGQHAEAGALLVPDDHDLTLEYVKRFGLLLEPALPSFAVQLSYVRGRRVVRHGAGGREWPFDLTAEDRELGVAGMWEKYVAKPAARMAPDALDAISVGEFLRRQGAYPEAVALLRVGFLDMMGEGVESYSALQMVQRMRHARGRSYTIKGGSDQLPKALAATLQGAIHYDSPALRIELGPASATVLTPRARFTAEHVVCALPCSVLRRIEIAPGLSPRKQQAIAELDYCSVTRLLLQFRRRIWTKEQLHMLTTTDLPVKWIFEHTVAQPGARGILEAQALGSDARRLASMAEGERLAFALSQIEEVFPGAREHYERGTSICWDEEPWARGAFAYFRPGQLTGLSPQLAQPNGRVHFAGDHTSSWSGWMQGALESGLRAAREVAASS